MTATESVYALVARGCLDIRVNQTSYAIREQNIDLAGFNERRHFAFAECRMHQGLPPAISASAIIGLAYLGRPRTCYTALVRNPRTA